MTAALADLAWSAARLGDALDALARHTGLAPQSRPMPRPPTAERLADADALARWIEHAAAWRGVEAEHVETPFAEVESMLRGVGPAIVRLPGLPLEDEIEAGEAEPSFLALVGARAGKLRVLRPDLTTSVIDASPVAAALTGDTLQRQSAAMERLLADSGIPERRRVRVRDHLLRDRFGGMRIGGCWMLREAPNASLSRVVWRATAKNAALLLSSHAIEYGVWVLGWWLLGRGALDGYLDPGWMWAWGFLLLAIVPFRMLGTSAQAKLSIAFGRVLKQRLLNGAFRIPTDELRVEGAGMLLGRVVESEAVEALALSGGLVGLVSLVELAGSAVILAAGAGAALLLTVFAAFVVVIVWLARRYVVELAAWTDTRLSITHDLVEKMVGHRTRAAQQPIELAHEGEDEALDWYVGRSRTVDRTAVLLTAIAPKAWVVAALLALVPTFASDPTQKSLAVSIGAVLLAYGALGRLTQGATSLGRAAVAWRKVKPLLEAAKAEPDVGSPLVAAEPAGAPRASAPCVLDAAGIVYRHAQRHEPVLRGATLRIQRGDRVLLSGPSGSGKSTLAATLAGLRVPQSGLLLLHGLDRHALGTDAWRRSVVMTPQFHENHVVTETFAFNLFMGADWPARPRDLARAEALCKELGLGELLARMPGGMLQTVGETGWQLSHGERSRVYIARALLQNPEVLILDESFGALDPENLRRALDCVERRAPTLVVIAHP